MKFTSMTPSSRPRRWLRSGFSVLALIAVAVAPANVLMQAFYWDVPSPAAGNSSATWWWDNLTTKANTLRSHGFTGVWLPPVLKGASGGYSMGYDPFDDYDIGSKNEMWTYPTRFGTREQLQKLCATLRANGLEIYLDIVDNHRNGDSGDWHFQYADDYGNWGGGRFGKSFYDFHPNVSQDSNVPLGSSENFSEFGRDLAPGSGLGGWVWNGLNSAGDWLTKALDVQGYRLDYVKGISTDWLGSFLNTGAMSGKFAVGEYFDDNLGSIQSWVNALGGRASAFDFPLRAKLKQMCDFPSTFDMSTLDHAGLTGQDPYHSVTFVENHDTDQHNAIMNNKALAYAYILTSEGYPCVFYRDYSTDPGCYGMQSTIDNLVWIHEKLASGGTVQRWKNNLVFVYERTGGNRLLVGLNNNTGYDYWLTCHTGFSPYTTLHDYTGHSADVQTNGNGDVTLHLPPAIGGMGYVAYAPYGTTGGFTVTPSDTTQEYAGASDLDIKPADNTAPVTVCRVYSDGVRPIVGQLYYDTASWTANTKITLTVARDDGTGSTATRNYTSSTTQGQAFTIYPTTAGWYRWQIQSFQTPAANLKPAYWLKVTYRAPQ